MQNIKQLMLSYASYHRDPRNKVTHFVGVPLIVYALFVALSWVRLDFVDRLAVPVTGATLFFAASIAYYLRLDLLLTVIQLPFSLVLLFLAEKTVSLPFQTALTLFLGTFIGGWIIQLIGHYFEGKKPALVDNIMQVFNAPLFLAMEIAFAIGLRSDLRRDIEASKP